MYNNITSNQAPGLTEHEKSIFLTRAQEALVKDYFSGKSNPLGEGFDDSERRQSDFANLISVKTGGSATITNKIDPRSATFTYPDFLVVLNEHVVASGTSYQVVPLSHQEYLRLMQKPYKLPVKGTVWRLISQQSSSNTVVELIGMPTGASYYVRGVNRPSPIILPDVQGGSDSTATALAVDGSKNPAPCALPKHLHDEILQRAVFLAKIAWTDAVAPQGQTNQR
jgi:hypothetical protein